MIEPDNPTQAEGAFCSASFAPVCASCDAVHDPDRSACADLQDNQPSACSSSDEHLPFFDPPRSHSQGRHASNDKPWKHVA